jgi:four helix bundle protein
MKRADKLEDSVLWKKVTEIAVDTYSLITELPREEEWDMKARLHQHAFAVTNEVAEAYGSLDPRDSKWLLSKARGNLFAIKSAYVLGYKTGELPEQSEVMVLINQSVRLIDTELQNIDVAIQGWYEALRDKTGQQEAQPA